MSTSVSKIDQYNLGERVLTLAGQGLSTQTIADTLTKEGPTDVSQSSVARWLKVRVVNLLKSAGKVMKIDEVSEALDAGAKPVVSALKELANEGQISRVYKDRTPYYTLL